MKHIKKLLFVPVLCMLAACEVQQKEPAPESVGIQASTISDLAMFGHIGKIAQEMKSLNDLYIVPNTTNVAPSPTACPKVYFNPLALTLVIDFGTEGCTGADGAFRAGRIDVQLLGLPSPKSVSAKITFKNFTSDGNAFDGAISIKTHVNINRLSQASIDMTMDEFSFVSAADGTDLALDGDFTIVWSSEGSINTINDSFTLTGAGKGSFGSFLDGISYSFKITDPCVIRAYCFDDDVYYRHRAGF
jgi:hypothetical protein